MKKIKLSFLAALLMAASVLPYHLEAKPFSSFKQKIIYAETATEVNIGVDQEGVTFKYSKSGSNPIGYQNYCGFWLFDQCDPGTVNGFVRWANVPSIDPGL